jgi:hypothetical protein
MPPEPHELHVLGRCRLDLLLRGLALADVQAELDVAADGKPREYAVFLKDDATVRPRPRHWTTIKQHLARGRRQEAADHIHQRGLPAS